MVWDLVQDEFADLLCWEGLHAVVGITSSDVLGHIARESWPPVVACDELQGFPTAWMACCWCIVVESEDVGMEALVLQDVDPSMVECHSFTPLPFIGMDPAQVQFSEGFYHWFIEVCSAPDAVEEVCFRSFDDGGFGAVDLKEGRVKEGDI